MRRQFLVQAGEEAATGGDAIDAKRDQIVRGGLEQVQHAVGFRPDDAVRRGASHDRRIAPESGSRRIADIAGQSLEAGIEDHDPDGHAVHGLALIGSDAGNGG